MNNIVTDSLMMSVIHSVTFLPFLVGEIMYLAIKFEMRKQPIRSTNSSNTSKLKLFPAIL